MWGRRSIGDERVVSGRMRRRGNVDTLGFGRGVIAHLSSGLREQIWDMA